MKDILSQLHKSFLSIGLEDAAKQIRVAQSLYKDEFNTEVRIFSTLASVLDDLKELKPHQIYKENKSLPGYAIETSTRRIIKDEESLKGYTKKEILSGINNYLHSFMKNYLDIKSERISYENEEKYNQAISIVSEALKEVQQATRSVSKGSVQKLVNKVQQTLQDIELFLRTIRRELPKVDHLKGKDRDQWRQLPTQRLVGDVARSWSDALASLEFNREEEMRTLDEEYIDAHDVDRDDFVYMTKAFRSHVSEANTKGIFKFAEEDEPDLDLTDETEETKPKDPEPRRFLDWRGPEAPVNHRATVTKVIRDGTLFTRDKSGKLQAISPSHLYRAYTEFLLPQFKTQYMSLLSVAHQNYLSMYQVQAVQNKLAKALKLAARTLGG